MKRNFFCFAIAGLIAVTPAAAETYQVGDLYGLNGTDAYISTKGFRNPAGGSVADSYLFSLSRASVVHVSLNDAARLTNLTASLYSIYAVDESGSTLIHTMDTLDATATSDTWQSLMPLSTGNYRIDVTGEFASRGTYGLELSSDVAAPVPGPAGLLVAGAGVVMLAFRRRAARKLVAA